MVAPIDISGERYGRLTAIRRVANRGRRTMWVFKCDCGTERPMGLEAVRGGGAKSCGCIRIEKVRLRSLKHGHSVGYKDSRTVKSWRHAKERCFNKNDEKFPIYGGRGITMCGRWAGDFREFLKDMGECPVGMSIDRIDPHGHYEPGNCRWATTHEQARTRTDNVLVDHGGQVMILKDFAEAAGVSYKALHSRIRYRGQTPHEAVSALRRFEVRI